MAQIRIWQRTGIALMALLAATTSVLTVGADPAASASSAPSIYSLHVVGGPVEVGDLAVVIYVDKSQNLHLAAIDPLSLKVVWQYPYSAVGVTPGVALTPIAIGNIVMDVSNTGQPKDQLVLISGIDAQTGEMIWQSKYPFSPSDAPAICAHGSYFCIPGYNGDNSTSLLMLQPSGNGKALVLNGPLRAMGPDLYETDANKPTLEQVSATGTQAWQLPVTTLFGSGFSPDDGWDFNPTTTLDVGTIEPIVKGNGYDVSKEKTLGINLATGAVAWSLDAEYQCGGYLSFLSTQIGCSYGGITSKPAVKGKTPSYRGLTISLLGFSVDTGAVTWTVPVRDIKALMNGDGLPFLDDTHVVVTLSDNQKALLDTSNGSTSAVNAGAIFWCQKEPNYTVHMPPGDSYYGDRASTSLYFGCTADGKPTVMEPATSPDSVGVTINGVFMWPSPGGQLRTRVIGTPESSV